jgi:MbtH protein
MTTPGTRSYATTRSSIHSGWPVTRYRRGWHRVGKEGSKEECSAYVDEVWTDMRPRSLRERMDAPAQS